MRQSLHGAVDAFVYVPSEADGESGGAREAGAGRTPPASRRWVERGGVGLVALGRSIESYARLSSNRTTLLIDELATEDGRPLQSIGLSARDTQA